MKPRARLSNPASTLLLVVARRSSVDVIATDNRFLGLCGAVDFPFFDCSRSHRRRGWLWGSFLRVSGLSGFLQVRSFGEVSPVSARLSSLFPQSGELWCYLRSEVGFGQRYAGGDGASAQFRLV